MLFDAHTHLNAKSIKILKNLHQFAVASTPEDCAFLEGEAKQNPRLYWAAGVHPWQSGAVEVDALLPWLERADAIGEIGMDSLWCSVDPAQQLRTFRHQLALAEELQKPIILHTKGCEGEILREIQNINQPILVHWYSETKHLQGYLEKDCYFTIGPDIESNKAVENLARKVPLNRLLVETDGAEAVSWAQKRAVTPAEIPAVLAHSLDIIAQIKGESRETVEKAAFENALSFLGKVQKETTCRALQRKPSQVVFPI